MAKSVAIQAVEALKELFRQVSAIKLREIKLMLPDAAGEGDILAYVEVYGHSRLLVCKVKTSCDVRQVKAALRKLGDDVRHVQGRITPVLIAPRLSSDAQALCRESQTGFLDLEGNARIVMDEVFFAKRSMPPHKRPATASLGVPADGSKPFAEVA